MKRLNSHKYNVLLVKDGIGVPKPCTRRLPSDRFTFGDAVPRDFEDAQKGKSSKRSISQAKVIFVFSYFVVAILSAEYAAGSGQGLHATEQVGIR